MARDTTFTAIQTEGGLLPPALLQRVSEGDKELAGLSPEAYHLAPGERLNEAINRSWNRLTGAWETFNERLAGAASGDATAQLTRQSWLLPLYQELGYGQLQPAKGFDVEGKHYPISHEWGAAPIHLLGATIDLDHRTPGVAGAAGMSPHGLVQEFLNRSEDHLWGFVSNGRLLRVLRDNVSLTRQAYVEFDLEAIFDGQIYADFTILWLLCHQSRVEGDIPEKCLLEQWAQESVQRGTRALDQLRAGVEAAITELGTGFVEHAANSDLRARLSTGGLDRQEYYRQLLRLVYRLIFLFVAEDRDLLLRPDADPTAAARFREYYSTGRLRQFALDHRGSGHGDLWAGLNVVFDALSSPAGEPALGLPGLGSFLWSPRAAPGLAGTQIENRRLLSAVRALATVADPSGRVTHSVDYRNLGSEELGSIYESLLELHPEIDTGAGTFSLTTAGGHERKTTGSYYTPASLINELLDSALDPVLDEAATGDDPASAILALTVLDPACGSGHFLIAAAHRIARRLAEVRTGEGEPTPKAIQSALRDVVARCIHGIDINPMAVELCKVSLWMEAMEPGKPLTFLEHRIVCGNALLGTTPRLLTVGIPDAAFKALEGDDKEVVKALKKRNKLEREGQGSLLFGPSANDLAASVSDAVAEIDAMPQDTVAELEAKERRWLLHLHSDELGRAQLAADAWCAAFVSRKVKGAPVITEAFVRQALAHTVGELPAETVDEVVALAKDYSFVHPHLAFPDVFRASGDPGLALNKGSGWTGGFSVVVGNPPWDRIKVQDKEFFAVPEPAIAMAPTKAKRKALIADLEMTNPDLFSAYLAVSRRTAGQNWFVRASGRFPLCGRGDVNTYAVFAELMRDSLDPTGRVGGIVPSGIATDETTSAFWRDLVRQQSLWSLFEFVNDGYFQGAGRGHMLRFCLITMTGRHLVCPQAELMFQGHKLTDLASTDRRFTLSSSEFELLNPRTLTAPIFRSRRDAEITKAAYRSKSILQPVQDQHDDQSWMIEYLTMLHTGDDSGGFTASEDLGRPARECGNRYVVDDHILVPLYEAKMVYLFNHRYGDYGLLRSGQSGHVLPTPADSMLRDPGFVPMPRFWVAERAVEEQIQPRWHHRWLLCWRDTTDARASARTVIPAVIPFAGAGRNNLPAFTVGVSPTLIPSLIANLSSFVLDFVARQKVGGIHLNFFLLAQLPVCTPSEFADPAPFDPAVSVGAWLHTRVLELVFTSWDLWSFAADVGGADRPFVWNPARREALRAELDACFFHLYRVGRADVEYIMDSFSVVRRKDEANQGEYRTKRLILEVYDAMASAIGAAQPYRTVLDPPPADPSCAHPESSRPAWARPPDVVGMG